MRDPLGIVRHGVLFEVRADVWEEHIAMTKVEMKLNIQHKCDRIFENQS